MSQNTFLNENKLALYFAQILNISIDHDITMMDIEAELSTINDPVALIKFIKEKFNYERFRFLTGYQKFLAIVKEFREENKPKLDYETADKVNSISKRFYSFFTDYAFWLDDYLSKRGIAVEKVSLIETFDNYAEQKVNEKVEFLLKLKSVIGEIGWKEAYRLANTVSLRGDLESEIERVVTQKVLISKYPKLANNKKDFEGLETIKKLQGGLK